MYTIGTTPKTICKIEESYSINLGVVATEVFQRGQMVKLSATGEAEPIADVTDMPFGMVVAGNKEAGEEITVQTEFNALVRCVADGSVAIGDEVACSGLDADNEKLSKMKKAGTTNYISGVALSDAADGESVMVGLYRKSVLMA